MGLVAGDWLQYDFTRGQSEEAALRCAHLMTSRLPECYGLRGDTHPAQPRCNINKNKHCHCAADLRYAQAFMGDVVFNAGGYRLCQRQRSRSQTTTPSCVTQATLLASARVKWSALAGKVTTSSYSSCVKVNQLSQLKPASWATVAGQMKLFVSEGNPHCLKVLAALEVTGVQCEVQCVNHEGKTAWLAADTLLI